MTTAPVAVALDAPDLDTAVGWARATGPHVSTVKVGLQLFLRHGREAVLACREASGGPDMVRAAAEALPGTMVAGVTVLTSMSAEQLAAVGFAGSPLDTVRRLAVLAVSGGARALVCSPLEVAAVRREVGPQVRLITPGVRPSTGAAGNGADGGGGADDQARVATAEQALADGADLLVVGRPLTGAGDLDRVAAAARDLAALLAA